MRIWVSTENGEIKDISSSDPILFPYDLPGLPNYLYVLDIPYEKLDEMEFIKSEIEKLA